MPYYGGHRKVPAAFIFVARNLEFGDQRERIFW